MNIFKCAIILTILLVMTGCGNASTDSATPSEPSKEKVKTPAEAADTPTKPATKPKKAETKPEAIKWQNYNEGVETAKNQKKKVFLTFYADWCRYCKVMDAQTFTNKSVISYLNKHYISIKVNSDKDTKTASRFQVRGIPVSWFISETGENIGSQPGYIPPDQLLPLLMYINTDSYKTMQFSEFVQKM